MFHLLSSGDDVSLHGRRGKCREQCCIFEVPTNIESMEPLEKAVSIQLSENRRSHGPPIIGRSGEVSAMVVA